VVYDSLLKSVDSEVLMVRPLIIFVTGVDLKIAILY